MANINKHRRPNKLGEFLLDVMPTTSPKTITIYDISSYLPAWSGMDRRNRLQNVKHTIKGQLHTVYIIDYHDILDKETAIKLAKDWYNGNTTYHRLD